MKKKNTWVKRLTAVMLGIGMILTPAASSGITYADVQETVGAAADSVTGALRAAPVPVNIATGSDANEIALNPTEMNITAGKGQSFTAVDVKLKATSSDAPQIDWATSNEKVATVTNGVVNGVAKGKATITATLTVGAETATATCQVTVTDASAAEYSLTLDSTGPLELEVDGTGTIAFRATATPSNAQMTPVLGEDTTGVIEAKITDADLTDGTGVVEVTAKKAGNTTVTISLSQDPTKTVSCDIVVTGPELKALTATDMTLEEGATKKIVTDPVLPEGVTISYTSSDEAVATVSVDGTVTAVKAGTATITIKADGYKEATCKVTVTAKQQPEPELKTLKAIDMTLEEEAAKKIETDPVLPEGVTVSYESSDKAVASVDANGTVTAVKAGEATITVTAEGYVPAKCKVTVIAKAAGEITTGTNVEVSVSADEVTITGEGAAKVTPEQKQAAVEKIAAEFSANTNAKANENELKDAVQVELAEGEKAVVQLNSELKDVEFKAEVKENGEVVLIPTKLTFNVNVTLEIIKNGVGQGKEIVANEKIKRTITFYLPLPSTITGNRCRVTHRATDGDDVFKNQTILSRGTKDARVRVRAGHFSDFVVDSFEDVKESGSSSDSDSDSGQGSSSHSGTSKTSSSGQWVQGAGGWWYKNADGTYPASTWVQLVWNGISQWYRFNEQGYMVSGWFTDADGNRYFLHNQKDGTQGYMYTGWHQIDGIWYYFRENVGGPQGSLLVNGTTPEGYKTDSTGAWIQ